MLYRLLKLIQRAKALAPELLQAIPLLEALEANDYERAAAEFLEFGEVKTWVLSLSTEQQVLLAEIMPALMRKLDELIPEERLLALVEAL